MDQDVFYLINHSWVHPWLDPVMAVASSWAFWWPLLLVAGLVVVGFGGFRARAMVLAVGLSVGVNDGLIVRTVKDLVGRPRPHEALAGARTLDLAKATPRFAALGRPLKVRYSKAPESDVKGNSFPSGHTSNTFAVATVLALFYPRRGWVAFIAAALVGYSRIYVGAHWPSDVLFSAFLGVFVAVAVVGAMDGVWRKWGRSFLPEVYGRHATLTGS